MEIRNPHPSPSLARRSLVQAWREMSLRAAPHDKRDWRVAAVAAMALTGVCVQVCYSPVPQRASGGVRMAANAPVPQWSGSACQASLSDVQQQASCFTEWVDGLPLFNEPAAAALVL